jgi:hypothetical protein
MSDGTLERSVRLDLHSARTTGLEPATTGSTVRYSNQLSYVPSLRRFIFIIRIPFFPSKRGKIILEACCEGREGIADFRLQIADRRRICNLQSAICNLKSAIHLVPRRTPSSLVLPQKRLCGAGRHSIMPMILGPRRANMAVMTFSLSPIRLSLVPSHPRLNPVMRGRQAAGVALDRVIFLEGGPPWRRSCMSVISRIA